MYQGEKQNVYQVFKVIRQLSSDNPSQQERLDPLEPLIAQKFSLLQQSIDLVGQKSLHKSTQIAIADRSIEIGKQSSLPTQNGSSRVQDDGIGIKSQYLERIFEVFRRLQTRREFPGTGIGLAICNKKSSSGMVIASGLSQNRA
ncbi:CHASE3 domain-containing protein [Nostoc sp.]|uniref:CHASE3 domain-containing protein n=1 Tax=Nostoc sp. TaxID=1180 RepID=UPI003FA56AE7